MNSFVKRLHIISMSAGVLAAAGFLYNIVLLGFLYPRVSRFEPIAPGWEQAGMLFGVFILLLGLYHAVSLATLVLSAYRTQTRSTRTAILLVLGILSGLMLLADISMLQDIGKQYVQGWDSSAEWIILFSGHILHLLYLILSLLTLRELLPQQTTEVEAAVRDHILFQITHTTGLLCGTLGLILIIVAAVLRVPVPVIRETTIIFSTLILAPYLITLIAWLALQHRTGGEWLDEMLRVTLFRAGFITMLMVIPLSFLLFYLQHSGGNAAAWAVLWLPACLMAMLNTFSTAVLWGTRR